MMVVRYSALFIAFAICCITGCQSVHTEHPEGVPVAMWPSFVIASEHGKPERPKVRDTVARALGDAGLHATVDDSGVFVTEAEERQAREVLLTDKRLEGTGAIVILAISAGSGRKTATGFEVPEIAPKEPMRLPTTNESK
jgi:hypothetical protein